MNLSKQSSAIIIGMALFAMFFGSGNLIFPLFIGTVAEGSWPVATLGFLTAAVLLPFFGVLAMVLYNGSYSDFFSVLGKKCGFLLSALLLTVWIPLGSAPRCMALAYASLSSYAPMPPLWLFAIVYSLLVFLCITQKLGVLDILGKWITPLLLMSIAVIVYQGISMNGFITYESYQDSALFVHGLTEGYNTMDLIASFFFSASIIHIINRSMSNMPKAVMLMLRASFIGSVLLALVYICLIFIAAQYAESLQGLPKDQLLATLAQFILGPKLAIFAISAIVLACFSTSVALIIAYADFLRYEVFKDKKGIKRHFLIALSASFVMALYGLEGITNVTAPVLKVCYPILICLIAVNIIKNYKSLFSLNKEEAKPQFSQFEGAD